MGPKDAAIDVRCSTAEKVFFQEAAEREGLSLSAWMRALANKRALEVVVPEVEADGPTASFLPGFGLDKES